MRRFCPRLVTMHIPLSHAHYKHIYLLNAHAPDSSKSIAVRQAFQERMDLALQSTQIDDLVVLAGDFNACTGTCDNYVDGVCGRFGPTYINNAGRTLRNLAATHELVDLLTFESQSIQTSFHGHRNGQDKQLDKVFMK